MGFEPIAVSASTCWLTDLISSPLPHHHVEAGDTKPALEAGIVAQRLVLGLGLQVAAEDEAGAEVGVHVGTEGPVPVADAEAAPFESHWPFVEVAVDGVVKETSGFVARGA